MKIISWLRVRNLIIPFLLTLLTWIVLSAYSIASYGNYSYEKPADGIIVLGAAVFGTEPSPVFRERINHGVELYQKAVLQ
jgi:uncharacterized SAM-binding protein YcdF (DUF218 family)